MTNFRKNILAFACVLLALMILSFNLPQIDDYHIGADEGTYYRQASSFVNNGLSGFKYNARNFINDASLQVSPHPMRVGHIFLVSIFIRFFDSIQALSFLSVICYLILIIVSYFYIKKLWNADIALLTALLLAISPIGLALARRALLDSDYYLFSSLTIFGFIDFIQSSIVSKTLRTSKKFWIFLLFLTVSLTIKETTLFILPFFLGYLIYVYLIIIHKHFLKSFLSTFLLLALIPALVLTFIDFSIFGIHNTIQIINIIFTVPETYMHTWGAGPWYQYLVDFIMISPIVSFFAFGFIVLVLLSRKESIYTWLLIYLFIYIFIVYTFFPKDIRFVINLDLLLRIFFAMFLLILYERYKLHILKSFRNVLIIIVLFTLTFCDLYSFNNYFLINKIYDPILFNLLTAQNIIPSATSNSNIVKQIENKSLIPQIMSLENQVKTNPTADNYFALANLYYNNKQYQESINANLQVVKLNPDYAEAYNNIAAAYGALGIYDKEIQACEQALKIKPDFVLARNNLAWAKSMLKK